jgi:hypothetical protein
MTPAEKNAIMVDHIRRENKQLKKYMIVNILNQKKLMDGGQRSIEKA